jgi:hypothetical protein
MKKIFITIAVALMMSISASAQTTKVVTDSVTFMPESVRIYEGVTKNGNPKWWIELPAGDGVKKVTLTESHVTSGRLLALIERRDTETGKYTYSVKFAEPKKRTSTSVKADLSSLKK